MEDERFFYLTLFAIAQEIEALGVYTEEIIRIQLSIGLPPAHFGTLHQAFERYFSGRGIIKFEFRGKPDSVYIDDVVCFPQAYAAAVTMLNSLISHPKVLVLDIGGFTADYLLMKRSTDIPELKCLRFFFIYCSNITGYDVFQMPVLF